MRLNVIFKNLKLRKRISFKNKHFHGCKLSCFLFVFKFGFSNFGTSSNLRFTKVFRINLKGFNLEGVAIAKGQCVLDVFCKISIAYSFSHSFS